MAGEDVKVTIGADLSPIQRKFAEAQAQAKIAGAKIQENLGLEGLKGERGLKTQIEGFFKDISNGANPATAAMGRLSESFKMSGATLVALAAVQFLYETMARGVEIAGKFKDSVKDALTITGTTSGKSVEQVGEEINRLKEDAKATDLGTLSALDAGATVVVQSLEKMQSVGETVKEDIMEHAEIARKLHQEEDEAATQSIAEQNDVLRLRIAGADELAKRREDELADGKKLLELQRQKDEGAIAALREQIDLKAQLRDNQYAEASIKSAAEVDKKAQDKIDQTNAQAAKAEQRAAYVALSDQEKIAFLTKRINDAEALKKDASASPQQRADARLLSAQFKEEREPLQKSANEKGTRDVVAFLKGNETDAKVGKEQAQKRTQDKDRLSTLNRQAASEKDAIATDQAEAMGAGHPIVSSLRKVGFGKTPGGGGGGSAASKSAQAHQKSLDGILKEISALNAKVGGTA